MKYFYPVIIISLAQALVTILACFLWSDNWRSVVAGSAISLVNLWILAFAWIFIFYKKRVAASMSVVVIKYGILILIFSQIQQVRWIDSNVFVFGVLINPVALILGGILAKLILRTKP